MERREMKDRGRYLSRRGGADVRIRLDVPQEQTTCRALVGLLFRVDICVAGTPR